MMPFGPQRSRSAISRHIRSRLKRLQRLCATKPSGGVHLDWRAKSGSFTAYLLLGTFAGTGTEPSAKNGGPLPTTLDLTAKWNASFVPVYDRKFFTTAAHRRLYVSWLSARTRTPSRPGSKRRASAGFAEGMPLARSVASDRKQTAWPAHALLYIGVFGKVEDTPLAMAFSTMRPSSSAKSVRSVRVCDIATAVALRLHGEDPVDHGFYSGRGTKSLVEYQDLGFSDEFFRSRVLKAAGEWLARQK